MRPKNQTDEMPHDGDKYEHFPNIILIRLRQRTYTTLQSASPNLSSRKIDVEYCKKPKMLSIDSDFSEEFSSFEFSHNFQRTVTLPHNASSPITVTSEFSWMKQSAECASASLFYRIFLSKKPFAIQFGDGIIFRVPSSPVCQCNSLIMNWIPPNVR